MRPLGMLRNRTKDMTYGTPALLILQFAMPLFLGDVFQMLYNIADAAIVGRFLGAEALASVGAASPGYSLFVMVISGFANGASVVVAQAFGSGNEDRVKAAYTTSFIMLLVSGTAITLLGGFLVRPLLILLHTPDNVLEGSQDYLRWMCMGILTTCLYNGMASILRAVGNSTIPLIALAISSVINILLDYLFVVWLHLGIRGAAIATILAQLLSGSFCGYYAYRNIPAFHLGLRDYKVDRVMLKSVVRVGIPAALSVAAVTVSVMLIQRAVNIYGSDVVAAYTVASRTENIFLCLSFSIGMATGIFTAQNVGAKKDDRVIAGLKSGIYISLAYHIIMGAAIWLSAAFIVRLFSDSPKVLGISREILHITASFAPVLGLLFVFQNFLRNVSDVIPTVWMSGVEILCRGLLPFALSAQFGYYGIWWATPAGWVLSLGIGIARYRSGRWREKMHKSDIERLESNEG